MNLKEILGYFNVSNVESYIFKLRSVNQNDLINLLRQYYKNKVALPSPEILEKEVLKLNNKITIEVNSVELYVNGTKYYITRSKEIRECSFYFEGLN